MKKLFILFLALTFVLSASLPCSPPVLDFDSPEELHAFFQWTPGRPPVLSAHRGGPYPGYPENCIESFENILSHVPATLETDVRITRDSVLILMHDRSLERTSTGRGIVAETSFKEIKDLHLKDNTGAQTPYRIPSLKEALIRVKGKSILNLDIKSGVPFEKVVDLIHETGTEASVIIIVYNIADGIHVNRLDPGLMLSLTIRNDEELQRAKDAGIPLRRVTAFTGTRLQNRKLYRKLHNEKIFVNCGTLGNLDRKAMARGDHLYKRWERLGIDIFSTDRPLEAARVLYDIKGENNE